MPDGNDNRQGTGDLSNYVEWSECMETQTLHRGRLIDHLQLVVKDLAASQRFYTAILATLNIPMGGRARVTSGQTSSLSPPSTARRRSAY